MSKVCPHNNQLHCDCMYQIKEFYRQKKLAFAAGAKSFNYVCAPGVCPANYENCARYMESVQQKQR